MTLPIGRARTERRRSATANAFTLVELIIVMALLVIVISIAMPTLAHFFHGRSLDSEAQRFLALTHAGQSRAASEGIPMLLWVDTEAGTYGLEEQPGYDQTDPKALDFKLADGLKLEVVRVPTTLLLRMTNTSSSLGLPGGNIGGGNALGSGLGGTTRQANLPGIWFMPDGSIGPSSLLAVHLTDRDGASLWLTESTNRWDYEIRKDFNLQSEIAGLYP